MNDTVSFLLKVLLLSAGLSYLIRLGGPMLPVQSLDVAALNYVAIAIILLPSILLGTFLFFRARSEQ